MKLIEKLKGAHERPYVAYKVVGYYSSYNEAKEALNNAHTLNDVYHSWLELHSLNVSSHTMKGYECAYHHLSSISHRPINEITYMELQNIISTMLKSGLSYSSCKKVRSLLNQLYSFAIINDWCSKSYSQYLNKVIFPIAFTSNHVFHTFGIIASDTSIFWGNSGASTITRRISKIDMRYEVHSSYQTMLKSDSIVEWCVVGI